MTENISGSKKGGGGGSFSEADNTLQSTATVKVLEVISQGPIVGLVGGAKGIFLNNVPLQNEDGTKNFGGTVGWDQRTGLPDQAVMTGFPSAAGEYNVSTQVTNASPVTYSVTNILADAVVVTVGLPEGLAFNDTSNNRLDGTSVEMSIERRLGAGTWAEMARFKIEGKNTSPYEEGHRIERPQGAGAWSVRVNRLTADNGGATLKNATWLNRITEIEEVQLPYNDVALVGVSVDAKTVSSSTIPTRSYLADGRIVAIPSNYNPSTRVYTGVWNGEFKYGFTKNPAWILFDLLLDPTAGMGDWVTSSQVDRYSFYNAAVYNDELVDDGKGGTEPRFEFNYWIISRQDAAKWLNDVAASMNSKLVWMGGKATVIQDRPTSVSRLITTSNVINGDFKYIGSAQQDRVTAALVTWNDPAQHYQQSIATVDKYTTTGAFQTALTAATTRYGYNTSEFAAVGCTSEGQARRAGRWKLDTVLNQTETVQFKMFVNGYDLAVGEVVDLFDENYAGAQQAGRLIAGSSTTSLLLDRPVTVTAGTSVKVRMPDGTLAERTTNETSGSYSTLTFASALPSAPAEYTDFLVTTTLAPRQFKITKVSVSDDEVSVTAVQHDPNKYSRIESNIDVPAPVFSVVPDLTTGAPSALLFREVNVNEDNTIVRSLNISWQAPTSGVVVKYLLKYQSNKGGWNTVETSAPSVELPQVIPGAYEVKVYAVGYNNVISPSLDGTYTIAITGGGASTLNAVTGLTVVGGGTTFANQSLDVVWTNPSSNAGGLTLRDFEVSVLTDVDAVLRTTFIPAVVAGQTQSFTYTYEQNVADGGPRRTVKVSVRCRDTSNNFSSATMVTFTNSAPAAPTAVAVSGGIGNIKITYTKPTDTDLKGVLVWRSTTNGFTPSSGNFLYETNDNYLSDMVDFGTTYYYKLAAYDAFSRPLDGAGLNLSAQVSGAAVAGEGIPEVAVLPNPSGYIGPKIVFLTTDGQLYSYIAGAWQATIPPVSGIADGAVTIAKFAASLRPVEILGALPTTGNVEGRLVYLTGDNKLYRYDGANFIATVPSTDITGTLTDAQLSAIAAAKITGTIASAQIADAAITTAKFAAGLKPVEVLAALPTTLNTAGRMVFLTTDSKLYRYNGTAFVATVPTTDLTGTLTDAQLAAISAAKITGQITSTQITDDAITTPKIAAGAVTAAEIAANTITAGQIAASTITGTQIAGTTITAANIAAGTITATQIATDTITAGNIAAGAIGASEIAAGAIRTDKLYVTGKGTNLWSDANFFDLSAWAGSPWGAYPSQATITDGVSGGAVARNAPNATGSMRAAKRIPLTIGRRYKTSCRARSVGAAGQLYVRMDFDTVESSAYNGTIHGSFGSPALEALTVPTSWTYYYSEFVATSPFGGPALLLNNGASAGYHEVQDIRVEEMNAADLIVDGTIVGSKVAAGTITGTNIAADTITATQIAANAITATELNAGAVTTAKIAAGAVTANELAANSVVAGKIQAGAITATELAAGAITTSKLLVTGRGNAINDDPMCVDASAWNLSVNTSLQSGTGVANAVANTYLYCGVGTDQINYSAKNYQIGPAKTYRLSANLYAAGGNNRNMYIFVQFYDVAGAYITSAAGGGWGGTMSGYVYGGQPTPGVFVRCGAQFGAGTSLPIPATARTMQIGVWFQYSGSGTSQVAQAAQDIRLEEVVTSDLIVDGTITGTKLVAGSVTATQIAADTITASQIATGAITATELASGSVTTAKVAAGAITANEIAADTITAGNIAAGAIGAAEIAAGAIRTDKLFVTGKGKALNDDPSCMDISAWPTTGAPSYAIQADFTAPVGVTSIRCTNGTQVQSRTYAIEAGKTYKISLYAKQVSGGGVLYIRQYCYNTAGSNISYVVTALEPAIGTLEGITVPGTWTRYTGYITPPAGCVTANIFLHANWNTIGVTDLCDIRAEEYIGADLIVDGAIVAAKLAAGSVEAAKLAANSVVAGKIAASAINASNLIVDGTITTNHITANSLNGDRILAGSIVANKIDTRGLDIRDASNNVIFSSGTPLTSSYITPASGWLNSNVTVNSTGAISGIGTGNGTSVANNRDGSINAPDGGTLMINAPGQSGAIKIKLPILINTHYVMMKMRVEIYEYLPGLSCTLSIAGHTSGTSWYNVTASLIGGNVEYPVRYGHDGTNWCVWIGEAGETWDYPQVFVKEVVVGYSNYQSSIWATGWNVSLSTAAATNVTQTVTDTYPAADWSKTARRPTTLAGINSTEGSKLSGIQDNANYTTNTNQLTDGANLGGTAAWTGVSGTGKPADNASSDLTLVVRGTGVSVQGNRIYRTGGSGGWDADCYSVESFTGGAYASAVPIVLADLMFGLNTDPLLDGSYTSLDYALYTTSGAALYAYESGTGTNLGTTYAAGDSLTVTYDGSNVRYLKNGVVLRTVAAAANLKFYFDSSLASNNSGFTAVRFGPYGNPSAVQANNPITAGNASTYIASAAIGSAQVGTLTASNLTVTALSNTVNGSASSGARVVISSNAIEVYGSNNALRVRISA